MPLFTRNEKLILRATDRKDLFAEKFAASSSPNTHRGVGAADSMDSNGIYSHGTSHQDDPSGGRDRSTSDPHGGSDRPTSPRSERSASESSDHSGSLVEAIPWRDPAEFDGADDTTLPTMTDDGFTLVDSGTRAPSRAGNQQPPPSAKAFDQQSRSSKATRSTRHKRHGSSNTMAPSSSSDPDFHGLPSSTSGGVGGRELDTHFFPSSLVWNKADEETGVESVIAKIDVNVPTCSFSEEVGDVRILLHSLSHILLPVVIPNLTLTF